MSGKQPKRLSRPGVDEYGRTPLQNAVIAADETKILALLGENCEVDVQDDNGWTALHFAAQEGKVGIVRALLARGANANVQNSHGNSSLWVAVMNASDDLSVIKALLDAGADPALKNLFGRTPRDIAQAKGFSANW